MTPWLLLLAAITFAVGAFLGHDHGRRIERGEQSTRAVDQLNTMLHAQARLVGEAKAASRGMRAAAAQRAAEDARTTREFKDVLQATAGSRDGCEFPADVVRQLDAARERAAQAAAGGLRAAVPAAGASAVKGP